MRMFSMLKRLEFMKLLVLIGFLPVTAFAGSLPLQGTDVAVRWDNLYLFLVWLSVFFFVIVVGAMMYFAYAYRNRPGRKTKYITGTHLIEGVFVAIPTVLLMIIFGW